MQRRKFVSLLLAVPASALVAGCQKDTDSQPTRAATLPPHEVLAETPLPHDAKVLKIGMDVDFAPFEFNEAGTNRIMGFDVDLARAIARQLNKIPEIEEIPFLNLISALESGQVDMVISSMAITEERKDVVAYSRPYYKSSLALVTNESNNSIKSIDDLRGKKIGARHGSTSANKATQISEAKVVLFDNITEMMQALHDNKIDAAINDLPVVAYYIIQGGNGKIVGDSIAIEDYGIAVQKDNLDLLSEVNHALDTLEKNGVFTAIMEKWFGK